MFQLKKISFIIILFTLFITLYGDVIPPSNIQITYSETSFDITWDSVPEAIGYNVYTSNSPDKSKKKKIKVNKILITSGTHFAYIWHFENGEKVRKIKGYKHYLSITSVFSINGKNQESGLSLENDNCYFDGFKQINSPKAIQNIIKTSQITPKIPVINYINRKEDFIQFMEEPGRKLADLINKHIDPRQTGGCEPVSTILVKILKDFGLHAYKAEGNFIKEFHSFAIINIDSVEYILDFTSDQFIPKTLPVMIPRDYCHLNEKGKLSLTGSPVFSISKIFSPDQISLSNDKSADIYKKIYEEVIKFYK
jgi:hypothetical protein